MAPASKGALLRLPYHHHHHHHTEGGIAVNPDALFVACRSLARRNPLLQSEELPGSPSFVVTLRSVMV